MQKVLALLADNPNGLTKEEIITKLDPHKEIYVEGKVKRGSAEYGSWSRTILTMVKAGLLTQSTTKTIYKKA